MGHGLGMYRVIEPEYWTVLEQEQFSSARTIDGHVHNEPLEFAVETGLPAAIVYLAILLVGACCGLFLGLSARDRERRTLGMALAAALFAFLVDGFSDSTYTSLRLRRCCSSCWE